MAILKVKATPSNVGVWAKVADDQNSDPNCKIEECGALANGWSGIQLNPDGEGQTELPDAKRYLVRFDYSDTPGKAIIVGVWVDGKGPREIPGWANNQGTADGCGAVFRGTD